MPKLFSQMEAVSHRFEELSIRLNQPETAADPALFRRLMQEYHELEPVVDAYRKLATAKDHLEQAKALLEGETLDADFKEMVQQEVSEKSQDVAELENNLKILLLPKDANDEKSVILELRSGAGGEEAALFAHSLMRMYSMYVQSRGWEWEVLNLNETELGGVKEAIIAVNGRGAYNRLKYESGVHRVQRVPETETHGVKQALILRITHNGQDPAFHLRVCGVLYMELAGSDVTGSNVLKVKKLHFGGCEGEAFFTLQLHCALEISGGSQLWHDNRCEKQCGE